MLELDPSARLTCTQCLQHPYFAGLEDVPVARSIPVPSLPSPASSMTAYQPDVTPQKPSKKPNSLSGAPLRAEVAGAADSAMMDDSERPSTSLLPSATNSSPPANQRPSHQQPETSMDHDMSDNESSASTLSARRRKKSMAGAHAGALVGVGGVSLRGSGRRDISEMHAAAQAAVAAATGVRTKVDMEDYISRATSASSRVSTPAGKGQGLPSPSTTSIKSNVNQSPERFSASTRQQKPVAHNKSHLSPPHGSSIPYTPMLSEPPPFALQSNLHERGLQSRHQPVLYQQGAATHTRNLGQRASRADPWEAHASNNMRSSQQGPGPGRPTTQQFGRESMPPLPPGWRNSVVDPPTSRGGGHHWDDGDAGGGGRSSVEDSGASYLSKVQSSSVSRTYTVDMASDRPSTRAGQNKFDNVGGYNTVGYHLGPGGQHGMSRRNRDYPVS